MASTANLMQLRLVIPPSIKRDGKPVYERVLEFFKARGSAIYLQEKLLKLSKTLPVICEGEVSEDALQQFLVGFPDIDKMVILTTPLPKAAARAAA